MINSLTQKISKNNSSILICKTKSSEDVLIDLCKKSLKKFKRICIITINKPYSSLVKKFNEKKVDHNKFHFVDCISATFMQQINSKNCTYISSPKALTELAITINGLIDNTDLIILDNVSGLFIHNGELMTLRFLNSIISNLSRTKVNSVYLLMGDTKKETIANISLFADEVVKI
jgi:hypothetical protein